MTRFTADGPVLALATTLIVVAVLEIGARALTPPAVSRMTMFRPAPDVGYELIPGWKGRGPGHERIRINAAGLRGREIDGKTPETIRMVVIGDSFTFGLGVDEDDTLPMALDRALAAALGSGTVEVLNGGVPGYNLYQESRVLAARAATLAPDVIGLGFVENDLYNLDGGDFVAGPNGALLPRDGAFQAAITHNPFAALSGPWLWLQLHSAAFRLGSMWAIHRGLAVHGDADLMALVSRNERATDLPTRLLRGDDDDITAAHWEAAGRGLRSAAAAARQIGVPLVLVLLPRPEQLYAPRLRGGFARMARAAAEAGILVVDPAPRLAEDPDRVGLYLFPVDHHPSARCYDRIAAITAEAVVAAGILPPHRRGGAPPGN